MGWGPGEVSRWIGEHLGPTLKQKFPAQKIQVIMLDDNKFLLNYWARTVCNSGGGGGTMRGRMVNLILRHHNPMSVF